MNSDYAQRYRDLYTRHWWWRAREESILRALRQWRPALGREQILDVGCGDGLLFDQLKTLGDVEGVELNPAIVSADGPWYDKIHVGPFDKSFQPGHRFSVILMLDVLEHFADPVAALQHARALLSPGGLLLIHVPAFRGLWTSHDDLNHHYTRFTKTTLDAVVRRASLAVSHVEYSFYWTFPVKLVIRIKERLIPGTPQLPRVPGRLLNWTCLQLCRCEQRLARYLRPSFGSSLLAVVQHAPEPLESGVSAPEAGLDQPETVQAQHADLYAGSHNS